MSVETFVRPLLDVTGGKAVFKYYRSPPVNALVPKLRCEAMAPATRHSTAGCREDDVIEEEKNQIG